MAMLAEKRTKKPKYNLIRAKTNANWAQETNSWGLKMLQKMGWSEGKGLGVDGSGTAEPLHIAYKNDNRGLGCLNLEGDMAVSQQKDFDALLANLAQDLGKPDEAANQSEVRTPKSLELMSQKSRARVHYHKFTRGKDLSRASKKDLASILGIAESNSVQEKLDLVVPAVGPRLEDKLLKSSGSSVDYFKKLKESKKWKAQVNCEEEKSSEDAASNEEDNSPMNTSIFNSTQDSSFSNGRRKSVTWGDVEVSFVSKYIKDMVDTSTESVDDASPDVFQSAEAVEENLENKHRKKKSKKSKKRNKELCLNDGAAADTSDASPTVPHPKTKKKKNKESENNGDNVLDCSYVLENSVDDTTPKKLKKKSKNKSGTPDESLCPSETVEEKETIPSPENSDVPVKSKKKKRKHSHSDDSTNEEVGKVVHLVDESENKKVKKKYKVSEVEELDKSDNGKEKKREISEVEDFDESENKKIRKKKRKLSEVEDCKVAAESSNSTPSKKKTKRQQSGSEYAAAEDSTKHHQNILKLEETNIEANIPVSESNCEPALSALTRERMEKWKKRKQSKVVEESNEKVTKPLENSDNNASMESEAKNKKKNKKKNKGKKQDKVALDVNKKPLTVTLTPNPNLTIQNYNHRKVLAALGYDVKELGKERIEIKMPPTQIPGSSLDSILGYGEGLQEE